MQSFPRDLPQFCRSFAANADGSLHEYFLTSTQGMSEMIVVKKAWSAGLLMLPLFIVDAAHAQVPGSNYPSKPLRMLVGSTTGGSTDIVARIVATSVSARIGQQIVVENRAGANGIIATSIVVDGYTLILSTTGAHSSAPHTFTNLPYDPFKDLAPVALIGNAYFALIVGGQTGVKTVTELVALAKAKPGQLNYASVGDSSTPHLAGVMLAEMSGTQVTHVPYKGGSQSILDLAAGRIHFMFSAGIANSQALQRDGKVRVIAVSGPRLPMIPDVPAVAETYPDFNMGLWYGVFMPAGVPASIVIRMNREINAAVRDPGTAKFLSDASVIPQSMTPAELAAMVREDSEIIRRLIQKAQIKPQTL
jgi:tripartite-type tricarboxylate transporter receptor subunit TctC